MSGCQSELSIAAVVVTYNRLGLLKRCVEALRKQTRRLNEIIVVNNGSTDGTAEWVAQQADLTLVTQGNVGGAGGQATGIRRAHGSGFDWIWCMDDDGYAALDALERLVVHAENDAADWLNSLVIDIENSNRLAFGIGFVNSSRYLRTVAEAQAEGNLVEGANPFNGTLLSRRLVEKIGLPHPGLFIWGDEIEYHRRAIKASARLRIVVGSRFYHPASASTPMSLTTIKGFYKYYYAVRNYMAETSSDGSLSLSPRLARRRGLQLIRTLLIDAVAIPIKNVIKISILCHAVWAAQTNDLTRRYI